MASQSGPSLSGQSLSGDESVRVARLANGVTVATDLMPGLASTAIGVWVGAGARHERPEQNGVAHFLEHMAFKGTDRRTALQIAEEIEDVGGELNAYTSREITAYYARVLAEDSALGFDILADILRHPRFAPEDVALERGVILQEIGQSLDTPDDVIFDWAQETAYPDQPVGRSILGAPGTVSSFDSDALAGFMAEQYAPDRLVVAAAGAVDHDAIMRFAEANFGDLAASAPAAPEPARYQGGERREVKNLEQAHLLLGFDGPGYRDPEYFTSQIYATLLGGGMSSRLFQEAREKRGLCYSIFAQHAHYAETGLLSVYAGCGGEDIPELMRVVAEEMVKTATEAEEKELARARAQLRAGLLMGLEAPSSRAERLARGLLAYGRVRGVEELLSELEAVDLDRLRAYAGTLLKRARPTLTLYGPVAKAPSYQDFCAPLAA